MGMDVTSPSTPSTAHCWGAFMLDFLVSDDVSWFLAPAPRASPSWHLILNFIILLDLFRTLHVNKCSIRHAYSCGFFSFSTPSHDPTWENPYLYVGFTRAALPVRLLIRDDQRLKQVIQMLQPSGFHRHDTVLYLLQMEHKVYLLAHIEIGFKCLKTVLIPKTNLNYESKTIRKSHENCTLFSCRC